MSKVIDNSGVVHGKSTNITVVQAYAIKKGGLLLSTEYFNMLKPLLWQCDQKHTFTTTFNHVKNRGQWCPVCGRAQGLKNMRIRFATDPSVREKISSGHLKRLKKLNKYTGKSQREIASSIREHTTGILRKPSKHKGILKWLGCSLEEYRQHLESKFQPDMTWENRGFKGWHVDHIIPLNFFDLSDLEQLKKACHYTNLQPLWALDNQIKHDKI